MSQTRLLAAAALALLAASSPAQSTPDLLAAFRTPPDAAKPMVRWWWFGPAVEKPEILRELQQMKADGIGGAELAFVYPEQLDGNLPFLSPPMLDAVTYAQTEARRLGLRIDLTLCSGWPYGGPHIPIEQAATRLRIVQTPVIETPVPTPKLAEGESLLSSVLVAGKPNSYDPTTSTPIPTTSRHFTTPYTALFFIQSHTRQQVKRAAVGAEGYVLDPFSHDAVATHLKSVGEPLLRAFGPTPPTAIFSDSLEAYGADWTPTLPAEFQRRRGYNLLPHLPELIAAGTPVAEKVRHDYGQTLTELVDENYLTQINTWAHAHNTKFRSQTYGEPAVSFSSQRLVDLPEGEGPQWRAFSTLRWASSANHVFGNPITSGETFTWLHSPVFRATPLDMKAEADLDFIMGENQLIFHGWPYSPPASALTPGDPGWSLYAAAVFNDHNPWHPVMPAVTQYIARVSNLLRQGQPANQVAVLLPTDDAWATFTPGTPTQSSLTAALQKLIPRELLAAILSAGYNYDFIDAAAIEKVGLGTHQIVVIPPTTRIPLETLKKLDAFAHNGGKVLAVQTAPTLDSNGETSPELQKLLHVLPMVGDIASLTTALQKETTPDLRVSSSQKGFLPENIGFIRRKLTDSDIYFLVNTANYPQAFTATFATTRKFGVQINPDTAAVTKAPPSGQFLNLAPFESCVFIYTDLDPHAAPPGNPLGKQLADLSTGWQLSFPAIGKTELLSMLTEWTTNLETKYFSGEGVYSRDIELSSITPGAPISITLGVHGGHALAMPRSPGDPPALLPNGLPNPAVTRTGPGMRAWFLPPIAEAGILFVNGKRAGEMWHPPYTVDITPFVQPGKNHLEIHVYNTAINAWSALPPRDYKPLIEKYGDRFQMQDLDQVRPVASGLFGPIYLTEGTRP